MKENKPTVKVGKIYVSLQDFISAVERNTDNETVYFNIQDGQYVACIKFTVNKINTKPPDTGRDI